MSLLKNVALALVSVFAFLALTEGLLTAIGVDPVLYESDPLVGFSSRIPLYVPAERGFVHTAQNKRAFFNYQRFKSEKPEGTLRVFCMGGSTTFGRPYTDQTSFCGWLRVLLRIADPSRKWHVVNAGGISYASYRVAALMEELVEYEPDLFIIYSGHNEFLEARTYQALQEHSPLLLETRAFLNQTRTYSALKRAIDRLIGRSDAQFMQKEVLPGEVEAVLDDSAGLEAYRRDDALKANVLSHYRINLARMVEIANSVKARTLFVTPASNLRSCSPFKTERSAGIGVSERVAFDDWMQRARDAIAEGQQQEALDAVDRAIAIDSRNADAHYLRGKILYAVSRFGDARAAFQIALDEDVCPLRAPTETLEITAEVAAEHGVALVDWARFLDTRAENGIPGDDLFLDHVHPTIQANRMLAILIIERLEQERLFDRSSSWNDAAIRRVVKWVEARIDPEAHARAMANLAKVFGWAGKHDEARKMARRALETVDDAETHYNAGISALRLGELEDAVGHLQEALKRRPGNARALTDLGSALIQLERFDEAVVALRSSVEIDSAQARSRFVLGRALYLQGHLDEATTQIRAAIRIDPDRGKYYGFLGNVLVASGDGEAAMAAYDRALELEPTLSPALHRRSLLREATGDDQGAAEDLREMIRLAEGTPAYQSEALDEARARLAHLERPPRALQ